MMNEYREELKKSEELQNKIFEIKKSYLKKEELIEMLNNIDFIAIKCCNLELITGFICDENSNDVKILTKNIEID